MWFFELIRKFFFSLDRIIYNFIPEVYDLLIGIARTSVLTQADIIKMAERIYDLLAIFMVFKVTLSLITYVVNPDDFSDKNKGLSKLGTNIIISLSLLVLTPYIFRYAYQLQTIILEDNSLATLIFGKNENGDNFLNSAGEEMAYIAMTPFFLPDTSIPQQINCIRLITVEEDGSSHFNSDCSGLDENYDKLSSGTDRTMVALTEDNDEFDETALKNYVLGVEKRNFKMMFRKEILVAQDGDKNFVIEYKYILSTIVGVVIILLLINFCMDVALRSIKLAFLQLIAPIPILSYVDPKSGKDGLFKKWYQMCFKTFASLFVRLLALYFALYIIWMVADGKMVDIIDGSYQINILIKIFIIIGALMFAKQLPKILEGLGIKLDGDGKFFLNPFKKFEKEALGGKQILGLGAAGAAAGLAGLTNFGSRLFDKNNWKNKNGKVSAGSILKGIGRTAGSTIAGTTGAMYRGISKTAKGEKAGKIFANSYGEAMFAKLQREDLGRKGSTLTGRIKADVARITGNLNAAQRQTLALAELDAEYKNETEKIKDRREALKQEKAATADEKSKKIKVHLSNHKNLEAINKRILSAKGISDSRGSINVKDLDEQINNMKAAGTFYVKEGERFTDENGVVRVATKNDVANLVKSDTGKALDDKLTEEKDRALKYLLANDDEVKERVKILQSEGQIDVASMSAKDVKTQMINEQNAEEAVNAEYYTIEQQYSEREKQIDRDETTISEQYKAAIKESGLDKTSAEWIANEADNAARRVKSPQQEGWKPSGTVNSSSYVYNPRLGGTPGVPPGPGPGPGGPRP